MKKMWSVKPQWWEIPAWQQSGRGRVSAEAIATSSLIGVSCSSQTYWAKIICKYDKRKGKNAYAAGLHSVGLEHTHTDTHTDQVGHTQTGINHTTLPLSLGQVKSIFPHPTFLFLHLHFIIFLFPVCTKSIHFTNHSQTDRTNVLV